MMVGLFDTTATLRQETGPPTASTTHGVGCTIGDRVRSPHRYTATTTR